MCMPRTDTSNKLAEMRAKAMKNKVLKPFPFIELADFVPLRFATVGTAHDCSLGLGCPTSCCVQFPGHDDEDTGGKKRLSPVRLCLSVWRHCVLLYACGVCAGEVRCRLSVLCTGCPCGGGSVA